MNDLQTTKSTDSVKKKTRKLMCDVFNFAGRIINCSMKPICYFITVILCIYFESNYVFLGYYLLSTIHFTRLTDAMVCNTIFSI